MAGFALARYAFPGKSVVFNVILAGVLVPGVILAIPQYLLLARIGLTNSYWSVLQPSLISPFSIYLCRIFAAATVATEVLEAARTDGAGDWHAFARIALPMMRGGLVTVFLFQFVAIWNNFMLPYIMLGDDRLIPVTVGFTAGLAATLDPPLTTIRHPLGRISEEMVRLLSDIVAGRSPLTITVPTTLVLRSSSPA